MIEIHELTCTDCGFVERNDCQPPLGWSVEKRVHGEGLTKSYYEAHLCPTCAKKLGREPITMWGCFVD